MKVLQILLHIMYYVLVTAIFVGFHQWRSEGNWRPGANLNFAPPPKKKNDNIMSITDHVYNHIAVACMYILRLLT